MTAASREINVTIYYEGGIGQVVALEARLLRHYTTDQGIPCIEYKGKGKRKVQVMSAKGRSFLIVVRGWDTPRPDDIYGTPVKDGNSVTWTSEISAFDPRPVRKFLARLEANNGLVYVVNHISRTSNDFDLETTTTSIAPDEQPAGILPNIQERFADAARQTEDLKGSHRVKVWDSLQDCWTHETVKAGEDD